jgi:tetrahydrodipicolinate N-succinyltransferase
MGKSVIGNNCNIGQNVVIGPDVLVGNGCKIQNNVSLYKGTTHPLTNEVAPVTLAESITRLNDLKAKYTLHDADAVSHTTGGTHAEITADGSSTFALVSTDVVTMMAFRKRN